MLCASGDMQQHAIKTDENIKVFKRKKIHLARYYNELWSIGNKKNMKMKKGNYVI